MDRIPMTRDGYERLKADLDRMQNAEMIEVTKRVATAREGKARPARRSRELPRPYNAF